jgi:membrane-associated protein
VPEILAVLPALLGIDWLDPNWLLQQFGEQLFWVSLVIIFVECGLFFPFLPGDILLFSMGMFIALEHIDVLPGSTRIEITAACVAMIIAAFGGNVCGYEIGRKLGPPLYERDGRIIKRKHFDLTREFFARYGPAALVIGRFFAVVRTYITVVAGATEMERRRFYLWSFVGALIWVLSLTLLGYNLGRQFPQLGEHLEYALIAIMIVFLIPMIWEYRRHKRREAEAAPTKAGTPARVDEA